MKTKLLAGLLALAFGAAPAAFSQSQIWENTGIIQIPPFTDNIDAYTFQNDKGASFIFLGDGIYNTYDTLNFTNYGYMSVDPGFDFETVPATVGVAHRAANFVNKASGLGPNSGLISCGGTFTFIIGPGLIAGNLTGSSKCEVNASNIVNSGTINMTASSLIKLTGNNIDLSRGAMTMANPSDIFGFFNAGILDGYWGVGTADYRYFNPPATQAGQASLLDPANLFLTFNGFSEAISDVYNITNRQQLTGATEQILPNPLAYFYDSGQIPGTSNRMVLAVALVNTNSAFANQVFFPTDAVGNPFEIVVQWQWTSTNFPTGQVVTNNYFYLTDNFGEVTNLNVAIDGRAGLNPTYRPVTYNFFQGFPFATAGASDPVVPSSIPFIPGTVTNQYAAYEGIFTAGTALPTDVGGGNVTNLPGRIEITADNNLNLSQARLASLNYMLLRSTNNFAGSAGAAISAPNMDFYLRTTNAFFGVTNLVAPYLNHPQGICELWSARWTNVDNTTGITNSFHVLFVNSQLAPTTLPLIQTLDLTVTNFAGQQNNMMISDVLNITSNILIKADSLTITTNPGNIFAPVGQINFLSPDILWSSATPGLMNLTNFGIITTENSVYFGGSHTQLPYNTNLVNIPYNSFVNHGYISNQASLVWSKFFQNDGIFDCGLGSFELQQAATAILTNGAVYAGDGDIGIQGGTVLASNAVMQAGGALTFDLTALLDDGSLASGDAFNITNKNFWSDGNGINLPTHPAHASLLGTTITSTTLDYQLVVNRWAGADLGATPAGFSDNAAIGHLILDGNTNCTQEFSPATGANALYVDELDFRGFIASNVDDGKNYMSIQIDPGMKIYYGQALADGVSIAERLNGRNGGGFIWVSNYNNGFFSSTNVVYTDGTTNRLNTALVTSCDIDSNGDGIPNCRDVNPIPVFSPMGLSLTVTMTNQPAPAAVISWMGFPGTTNYLYAAPSFNSTNWQVLTNFVYPGVVPGRVTVSDSVKGHGPRFYRVKAGAP